MTFAINLSSTALFLNLLSYFGLIAIQRLPLSASALFQLDSMHPDAMGWGVLSVIMLTALVSAVSGTGVTKCVWDRFHKLQDPFDKHVIERVTRVFNDVSGVMQIQSGFDLSSSGDTTQSQDKDVCTCAKDGQWEEFDGYERDAEVIWQSKAAHAYKKHEVELVSFKRRAED